MTRQAMVTALVAIGMLAAGAREGASQGPVLQFQVGISVADFASAAEGLSSTSAFSVRVNTRVPTSLSWLTPVVGAVLLPYGSTGTTNARSDAPAVFVGNIFAVVPSARTNGIVSIEMPLLLVHAPGTKPHGSVRDYGRDLVILPTLYVHVGARGLTALGSIWSRLELFVQAEQNLTPNRDRTTGRRDYFNPQATFGASVRIGNPQ